MIRKRILLLFIAIILSFSGMAAANGVALPPDRGEIDVDSIRFFAQAARSLRDYDEENMTYISSITLKLDSDIMVVNGEEQNVLTPYITEGKELLLPITDIAEALGAEVDIDDEIGEITIADDGGVTVLDAPPDIENYQLYDIQEVADVLTLDYFIEGDDIVLTRPFQSKTLLVWMRPGKKLSDTYGAENYLTDGNGHYVLKYDSVSGAKNAYDEIKDLPDCENAAPNLMFFVFSDPPAVEFAAASMDPPNWGSARIHANLMKNHLELTGKTDTDIIVAVIDTGVLSTHPFLAGRMLPGRNFTVEPHSDNTTDIADHGTRVAGVVVDCTPENVKILPAKVVYDSGLCFREDVAEAIIWAADSGAKVINMSIGFINLLDPPDWDILISAACDYAVSHGVAVVTAAGNTTQGNPAPIDTRYVSPARLDSAITVTATDINDQRLAGANFGEAIDVAAPGVEIYSCSIDGSYKHDKGTSYAAPHAAAAVAMLSLNDPSLGYEGLKAALISICVDLGEPIYFGHGVIDFRELFDHEHEWGTGVVTAPTCTSQGYTTYTCDHCVLTEDRNFTPIDPNNHNYVAGTPVAPTCVAQGYTTYECSRCDATENRDVTPINPNAHNFTVHVETVAPTCVAQGHTTYECSRCDATENRDVTPISPSAHSFTVHVETVAPTCGAQGYTTYKCSRCDATEDRDFIPIDPIDHSFTVFVETVAPTCKAQGYTTYKCSRCEVTENRDFTPIDPNNHNYVAGTPAAPTCVAQGYTKYTCMWCGDYYNTDFVDVVGHTWNNWSTRTAATCSATGIEYRTCSVCNDEETRSIPIDPNAHSFTVFAETVAPTCVAQGYTTYKCSRCDATENRNATPINPNAHIWNDGVATTPPTVGSEGVMTFTCTLCGDTRTEPIAALPAKSVSSVVQRGTLTAGTAGTVTFTVTTVNIANGSYTVAVTGLPNGVSVQGQVSILNNSGTLTLSGNASTVAGSTANMVLTIDNAASPGFMLTISSPQIGGDTTPPITGGIVVTNNDETEEVEETEVPAAEPGGFSAFINGYPDKTFRGANTMSREEFVNILFKLSNPDGLPEADASKPSFDDVAPGRWSYDAIEWAVSEGIIEADSDGNFRPAAPLTRAVMAAMLVKMEGWTESAENIFSDIDDHPHIDAILKATKAGIFIGYPDNTFRPDNTAIRVEVVTALVRYLLGGEPTDEMWTDISFELTDISRSHWAYKYVALATTGYVKLPELEI